MTNIFKTFAAGDVVLADLATVSTTVWSGDINPLTTFYTASTTSSWPYYIPVYDKNPASDDSAAVQFSVAYGHKAGSGSVGSTTVVDNTYNTPSKAVYSQYKALLLPATETAFSFGGSTPDDIIVVNVNRARYKQKLDPGNWELRMKGTVTTQKFIDGSGAGENPTVNQSGRVFNIYSGSGGVTASNTVYGLAYPDLGILVFSSIVSASAGFDLVRTQTEATNSKAIFTAISGGLYFSARTEEKISSNYYFVRINNQEFNFSNNPSFVSGSNGDFKWPIMIQNPHVYVTTVGLYDNSNNLLAVAKLSRPLLKTFNREALVKVKIDF